MSTETGDTHESREVGGTGGADGTVMPGVKVRAHPGLCLGYGLCHRFARDVYSLDADGEIAVHLLDVPAELALEAWIGASVCPQRAITVIGEPESVWRLRRAAS